MERDINLQSGTEKSEAPQITRTRFPTNHYVRWSPEQDQIIINEYMKKSAKNLAKKVGHTADAVASRVSVLRKQGKVAPKYSSYKRSPVMTMKPAPVSNAIVVSEEEAVMVDFRASLLQLKNNSILRVLDTQVDSTKIYDAQVFPRIDTNHFDPEKTATYHLPPLKILCELYANDKEYDMVVINPFAAGYQSVSLALSMSTKALMLAIQHKGSIHTNYLDVNMDKKAVSSLTTNIMQMAMKANKSIKETRCIYLDDYTYMVFMLA